MNRNHARFRVLRVTCVTETSKERLGNHLKRPLATSVHEQDVIEVLFFDLFRTTAAACTALPRFEALIHGLNLPGCAQAERMNSVHCQKHVASSLIAPRLGKSGVRVAVKHLRQHFLERNVLKVVHLHENLQQLE